MITLSFPFAIIIAFIGLIFAIYLHSMGVQIATQAQVLKIGIDNAIYASPLLNNEQKAAILAQDGKYSALDNLMVDDLWRESASYIRFFSTDTQPLTMQLLETALQQVDPIYTIDQSTNTLSKVGLLHVGDQQIGELELLREGEDAFSDEIYGFAGAVEELHHSNKSVVIEVLQNVNVIVTVHFVGDTGEKERCQAKVEPLWAWLFSNRTGLLHIENEGFY